LVYGWNSVRVIMIPVLLERWDSLPSFLVLQVKMTQQLLSSSWCEKSKSNCLDAIAQYAGFKNIPYKRIFSTKYSNSSSVCLFFQFWTSKLLLLVNIP